MHHFVSTIKNIRFSEKSVPWILLVACFLAFGLLVPQLGYFQDDWNYVINHYLFGPQGIIEFLNFDGRPVASWVYIFGFAVLGYKPLSWHIAALLLRWLTATTIWNIFRFTWPDKGWQNLAAALIFVLYPFFTLQPLAVAYSMHWSGYLLFALSFYLMLLAQRNRFWVYMPLALLTQALHLFTLEFYSGIDLLRPIFLWIVFSNSGLPARKRLISTIRRWAPYLVVYIVFFVWRGFIYQAAAQGRNDPLLLTAFLTSPVTTILSMINNAVPDIVLILITSWYSLIKPAFFDFRESANIIIFLLSAISFTIFYLYFNRQKYSAEEDNPTTRQRLFVGILALLLSLLPVYAAGFVIHTKLEPWNSRLSLGSILGAALIVTSLIDLIVKDHKPRWVTLAIILALAIGWHLHSANDFRWAWNKQVNFYRQLSLRAPELKPGTSIIAEEEILGYMGDYPTSYGINAIYTSKMDGIGGIRTVDHWFYPLPEFSRKFHDYLGGEAFMAERAGIVFQGESNGSVVITFTPEQGQCLWVIRPEYAASKALSQTTRQLAQISYIDRIQQAPQNLESFLYKYLYTDPQQDWCTYYQQADLAYQYEEWDQVIHLWQTASEEGLMPENGFEYIPFIEAYSRSGDWQTAKKMTRSSQKTIQGIEPLLCDIWSKLDDLTPPSVEKAEALSSVKEELRCDLE